MASRKNQTAEASNTQIAEASNTAIAIDTRPAWAKNTGLGNENVAAEDLQIPQIGILQDLSPQIKRNKPEYIEGAEPGMLFNSITGELYSQVLVIPVYYRKEFLLWVPRNSGGGFRGAFPTAAAAAKHQETLEEKTEIVETAQNFVLVSSDEGKTWKEAVIPMSKSAVGTARRWNSMIRMREADRFSQVYILTVIAKSSAKGDYYAHRVDWLGWATEAWYEMGHQAYESIASGAKNVAYDTHGAVDSDEDNADADADPF